MEEVGRNKLRFAAAFRLLTGEAGTEELQFLRGGKDHTAVRLVLRYRRFGFEVAFRNIGEPTNFRYLLCYPR